MYKLTKGWPQHIESGAFVNPESNQEYLAWLAEGNTPEPYVPTPAELNAPIHAQLAAIDQKKIRALSDAIVKNDKKRLEDLELEAEALRAQLVQE